jgi:hypothetical protein
MILEGGTRIITVLKQVYSSTLNMEAKFFSEESATRRYIT